ncbi:MAG: hypothetical protein WBF71_15410 [Microthrixaceae bacterium]
MAGLNVTEFHVIRQLARSGPVKHWAGSDARLLATLVAAGLVSAGRTGATGHKGRQRTEVALTDRTPTTCAWKKPGLADFTRLLEAARPVEVAEDQLVHDRPPCHLRDRHGPKIVPERDTADSV